MIQIRCAARIVSWLLAPAAILCSCGSSGGSDGNEAALIELHRPTLIRSIADHVAYLAGDELQGRAPGTRGEEMTLAYLMEQYAEMGWRPGNPNGMFLQEVPLVGTTLKGSPSLHLSGPGGDAALAYATDFMGWTLRQSDHVEVDDAELVFVGYGIVAPEYGWDDYKDVDVAGKVLVMLVGDPPLPDSTMFAGPAMTYYGRWTYKYEIAASKRAAGAIIIHNAFAAGYPWGVVANSWSGEQLDIRRSDGGSDRCALEAWITEEAAVNLFASAPLNLETACDDALDAGFRPRALGITASVSLENTFREVQSYNVVAKLEGLDPKLRDEYIIIAAHWDHLGEGNPVDGDAIYNGALDNATGCAATLEIARAFAAHRDQMKRSVLIINTTAEESGLLGSYHYAAHPLYPLEKTVAMLNIDGLNVWGRTADMVIVGYGQSTLDDYLRLAIDSQDREIRADAESEKGYYYRSDHFPFAKKGVPALYADSGVDYRGRGREWGLNVKKEYTVSRYHKPQDEYDPNWDLTGAAEDIEALFRVALMIASTDEYPRWSEKSEFRQIRDAAIERSRDIGGK